MSSGIDPNQLGDYEEAKTVMELEKELEELHAAVEKTKISSSKKLFGATSNERVYDIKLHNALIKFVMEIHEAIQFKNSVFSLKNLMNFSYILEDSVLLLDSYVVDCFNSKVKKPQNKEEIILDRTFKLLEPLAELKELWMEEQDDYESRILRYQTKQLEECLEMYEQNFLNYCAEFNVADSKLISKMVEIVSAFEEKEYDLYEYLTVSENVDLHGKSTEIMFSVFHPDDESYEKVGAGYHTPSEFSEILSSAGYDYITHNNFGPESFGNLEYLNEFLKRLQEWRHQHYFVLRNKHETVDSDPMKLPIPDHVLENLTYAFIASRKYRTR